MARALWWRLRWTAVSPSPATWGHRRRIRTSLIRHDRASYARWGDDLAGRMVPCGGRDFGGGRSHLAGRFAECAPAGDDRVRRERGTDRRAHRMSTRSEQPCSTSRSGKNYRPPSKGRMAPVGPSATSPWARMRPTAGQGGFYYQGSSVIRQTPVRGFASTTRLAASRTSIAGTMTRRTGILCTPKMLAISSLAERGTSSNPWCSSMRAANSMARSRRGWMGCSSCRPWTSSRATMAHGVSPRSSSRIRGTAGRSPSIIITGSTTST